MYHDDLLNQLQNILIQMSAIGCFSDRFNGGSFAPSGRECQLRRGLANQKCQQNGWLSKFSLDLLKTLHLCSQSDEQHRQTHTHAPLIDTASLFSLDDKHQSLQLGTIYWCPADKD
ncbi:hypothetical protein T11_13684 [Trichinella zimbabwensis]|uniref:Uncharacterized protein n=1 Tax=Trichinella zimbabwensis TaxID=268475 RepID=A0A0V1I1L5_9BILA|nr:hypothetical protein T11_13684 [Trichinella zimbabwensis]